MVSLCRIPTIQSGGKDLDVKRKQATIKRLVLHFAMAEEAEGIARRLSLSQPEALHESLPAQVRTGRIGSVEVIHCTNGIDPIHKVDRIGMESAATTAWALLSLFRPCIYINAGTCGGFARRGGSIARSYLGGGSYLIHDHRVPLTGFKECGEGRIPATAYPGIEALLGIGSGPISSGSSLDATAEELAFFEREEVVAKDMEAAAIAGVARDWGVPFLALKTVTDLVDHPEPSHEQFLRNLSTSAEHLTDLLDASTRLIGQGTTIDELCGEAPES